MALGRWSLRLTIARFMPSTVIPMTCLAAITTLVIMTTSARPFSQHPGTRSILRPNARCAQMPWPPLAPSAKARDARPA